MAGRGAQTDSVEVPRRALSQAERELLLAVLQHAPFDGRDRLLAQVDRTQVVGICDCGCATVLLRVGDVEADEGFPEPIPNEAEVLGADGGVIGGVLVFERQGELCELELYSHSDEPIRAVPKLSEIRLLQVPGPMPSPDADRQLMHLWGLFMEDLTDEVAAEIERVLPEVAAAGYARSLGNLWGFTDAGIKRAEALEGEQESRGEGP